MVVSTIITRSCLSLFLAATLLQASSSSTSIPQDDEIPKVSAATVSPPKTRADLIDQFKRLSGCPDVGYYWFDGDVVEKVPEGMWGLLPWNWSYSLRVRDPLETLLEPYSDEQLIALMRRPDFHGCLKILDEDNYFNGFWYHYNAFQTSVKKTPLSKSRSWTHFLLIPDVLKAMEDAHEMNLGGANLGFLPTLPNLYLLKSLNLSRNGLTALPDAMAQMKNLGHLDISQNDFTALPDVVQHLTELTSFYAESNKMTQVPAWLGGLVKLETLDLSENALKEVGSLQKLGALAHIYLSKNHIDSLEPGFFTPALLEVDLSGNKLQALPDTLGVATNLLDVDVSHNQLKTLPVALGALKKLETLKVSHNALTEMPSTMTNLRALKKWDLSHNKLDKLVGVGFLQGLQSLNLAHNQLTGIPQGIGELRHLKTLNLSHNALQGLQDRDMPRSLEKAFFHSNDISIVPISFMGRSALQTMTLDSKAYTNIPNQGYYQMTFTNAKGPNRTFHVEHMLKASSEDDEEGDESTDNDD